MSRSKADILANITETIVSAKKLANNTFEIVYPDGRRAIRLHDTNVVVFNPDGSVTLDSGGYRTMTTKDRINRFQHATEITQKNGIWYLSDGSIFEDGVTFRDGVIVSEMTEGEEERLLSLKNDINRFVCLLDQSNELPKPSAGDCLICRMGDNGNNEHLISHIEEGYLHASLLENALYDAGYDAFGISSIYAMNVIDTAKRCLRNYLMKRLLK